MIEKISDFFKDVKDRLSNPLLSSFLIAWTGFNWRIVIGLIFYKQQELKGDGYDSYIDLIKCETDWCRGFLFPLSIGLFYSFIFPAFRNLILAAGAWYKKWGGKWVLNISKGSSIPTINYIDIRDKYFKSLKAVEEVVSQEQDYKLKNQELETSNSLLRNEMDEIQRSNEILRLKIIEAKEYKLPHSIFFFTLMSYDNGEEGMSSSIEFRNDRLIITETNYRFGYSSREMMIEDVILYQKYLIITFSESGEFWFLKFDPTLPEQQRKYNGRDWHGNFIELKRY